MTEKDPGRQRTSSRMETIKRSVDRLTGVPTVMPRVLDALSSLHTEGVPEARGEEIAQRMDELYPPEYWWQRTRDATFYRALDLLREGNKITGRHVYATEALEKTALGIKTNTGTVYKIAVPETSPSA